MTESEDSAYPRGVSLLTSSEFIFSRGEWWYKLRDRDSWLGTVIQQEVSIFMSCIFRASMRNPSTSLQKYASIYNECIIPFSLVSMRKILSAIAFLIVLTGGVFAAYVAGLFPDSVLYPRFPQWPGTIGGAIAQFFGGANLSSYNGDGTVNNTTALSGVTATGFLRSSGNCGATKVWTSLAGGLPTCADKNGVLAMMGTVGTLSGTAMAYHADGTWWPITGGTGILEGDIIKTTPGSVVTIAFSDLSILRIGSDSTVSLDVGTSSGISLAYAILENGSLWWRVLTETGGYYIGRDDLIVGVRGTAVAFRQDNPTVTVDQNNWLWGINKTQAGGAGSLTVLQSTSIGSAGTILCRDQSGLHTVDIYTGSTLGFWQVITWCTPNPRRTITDVYSEPMLGQFITENTLADLDYMSWVLAGGNNLTLSKINRIRREFDVTNPTSIAEKDAICPDRGWETKYFWPSLVHTHIEACQRDNVLAISNFWRWWVDRRMFFSSWTTININASNYRVNVDWLELYRANNNDTISYKISDLSDQGIYLHEKTIRIRLATDVGTTMTNGGWKKAYILDVSTEKWYILKDDKDCSGAVVAGHLFLCKVWGGGWEIDITSNLKNFSITINSFPSVWNMVIWNLWNAAMWPEYWIPGPARLTPMPIWAIISSITILD